MKEMSCRIVSMSLSANACVHAYVCVRRWKLPGRIHTELWIILISGKETEGGEGAEWGRGLSLYTLYTSLVFNVPTKRT